MRKSVIILVIFAFLLILVGISSAQERGKVGDPTRSEESHKGDKGISFSVSGLSKVGIDQYEGGIGGKYWISRKLAIISSLGVSAERTATSKWEGYTDEKSTESRFSVFAGVEDHFFIKNRISPYWGGGVRFSTATLVNYPPIAVNNPSPYATKKEKSCAKTFGIRGFCGIEYFFAEWVSLAGQYQIDYFYEKGTGKTILVGGPGVTQPKEQKSTRTVLGLGTSALVATFYIW